MLVSASSTHAQDTKQIQHRVMDVSGGALDCQAGTATRDLHANNVIARLYNTGGFFWRGSGNVYEVPAYGGAQGFFHSAIWLGGMVGGEMRFAGTVYGPFEFYPGPLDEHGNPPEDCTPYDRIYSVSRKDLRAFEAGFPHTADIEEWPWDVGAPVEDGDGDPGNYNLGGGDRPQVLGHQTAWWVLNDAAGVHQWSKSLPIQMEVQTTAFAVSTDDALDNTTFYRFRLIYRGSTPLSEAWFGMWADPDLGNASDDLVGADTTHEIAYVYNRDDFDEGEDGYGDAPPALGYLFLQGPLVNGNGIDDDADGIADEGDERLGLTNFLYYSGHSGPNGNPSDGREAYGYLRGIWRDGRPVTLGGDGYGGQIPTKIMFAGDPVTSSYWSERNTDGRGSANPGSDRRFLASTGPFSMNPGDVQDIVLAIVWSRGADHLDSITRLREDAAFVRSAFDSGAINEYPVPERLPAPDVDVSPSEISIRIGPGESSAPVLTITNTGNADLQWTFSGQEIGITRFLTIANAAGPLNSPDQGTFAFNNWDFPTPDGSPPHCVDDTVIDHSICNDRPTTQQQVGPGRWGIAAGGGSGPYSNYLDRSIFEGGRSLASLGAFDYEWRFTDSSKAVRWFEDGALVDVPFQLWNTGIATPEDPSDDYQMIAFICEAACEHQGTPFQFDIAGDHRASGGANDPLTDWIYWMDPIEKTPGSSGYDAFINGGDVNEDAVGTEVLARQVIVGFNAGTEPPYPQELPEPGTIFRLETAKSWVQYDGPTSGSLGPGESTDLELIFGRYLPPPGVYQDTLIITSRAPENPEIFIPVSLEVAEQPTNAETPHGELPARYTLDQNYPNPFNPTTTIRYGLPEPGHVRLAVYDVLGRRVRVLAEGPRPAGWHTVAFEASGLPSGLYFYQLEAGGFSELRTMMIVK